ncbi:MAG: hypothetical protein P1U57_02630 [Oleibacter sp.]|nr:hypothetical protein [Thalassolituus sp.]
MKILLIFLLSITITACFDKKDENVQSMQPHTNNNKPVAETNSQTNAQKYTVNPDGSVTRISSVSVCPEEIPDAVEDFSCFIKESQFVFYTEGNDFIGISPDSLVITAYEVNNQDVSTNRKSEPNIELDSFPKISDDGTFLTWKLKAKSGYYSVTDHLKLSGYFNALKSDKLLEVQSAVFDPKNYDSFMLDNFYIKGTTVSDLDIKGHFENQNLTEDELKRLSLALGELKTLSKKPSKEEIDAALSKHDVSEDNIAQLFSNFLSTSLQNIFSPSSQQFGITIKGDIPAIEKVEIVDGGNIIKSTNWSRWDDKKTYNFSTPSSDQVSVKIYYWNNVEESRINFSL